MDESQHRPKKDERLLFIQGLAKDMRAELVQKLQASRRAAAERRTEDLFANLEALLPSHDSSLREARTVLKRLRQGTPNLPSA